MSALISDCGKYRYWLKRPCEVMHPERGTALFCLLNPSKADHEKNDNTVNRLRAFCRTWQNAGFILVNAYGYRATKPKDMDAAFDPVGELNDHYLMILAKDCGGVVVAWGAVPKNRRERINRVVAMFVAADIPMWCFGVTKNGDPRHPLYVKGDIKLVRWYPQEVKK